MRLGKVPYIRKKKDMEGIRLVDYDGRNSSGFKTLEVLKENVDGKHTLLIIWDDNLLDFMSIDEFRDLTAWGDFVLDKEWLRNRKLKSIGI